MAINFPNSPTNGDSYVAAGVSYIYESATNRWVAVDYADAPIGYTGSRGSQGFTGSRGDTGYTGSLGYTGSQGAIGYTGSQGVIGYTGSRGYTGSQGVIGYTGSQGVIGYTGSAGTTIASLNDVSDVTITSPANGDALIYNGSSWVNGEPGTSVGQIYAFTVMFG